MKHLLPSVGLVLLLGGCGTEPPPPSLPTFELRDVVDARLAALDAAIATEEKEVDPASTEDVRGLLEMMASSTWAMRNVAKEEAVGMGEAVVEPIAAALADPDFEDEAKVAGIEVLGALDTPRAAAVLLDVAETSRVAALRTHAFWRLGEGTQRWVVPRIVLRLKYEKDHDATIWLAKTLAHFGNYAGLGALQGVAIGSDREEVRLSAAARTAEILQATGFESLADIDEAWQAGDPEGRLELPPTPSPRFAREVWRRLARLREFQLRGVDDTRWICSSLGPPVADLLAEAIHDSEAKTRVHAAQCLERMGKRGRRAVDALVAGLADPVLGPVAANALGAIGDVRAEPPLLTLVNSPATDYGLRLAAVRALGGLGIDTSKTARTKLVELFDAAETPELHQAAGESLVLLGEGGNEIILALADLIASPDVEPVSSETVLRTYLADRAETDDDAKTVLEEWDALALDRSRILEPHEAPESRAGRRAIVRKLLGAE